MNLTEEDPDIVVLGFDTTLTYEKLSKACHYIRNGCIYFGINPDWNCPMEGGAFIPDCGSIAKLIEASTGRFPEFFGKPSKHTLDYIIQETGYEPDEIAIVGDRLYTDIAVQIKVMYNHSGYNGMLWKAFRKLGCVESQDYDIWIFVCQVHIKILRNLGSLGYRSRKIR